MDNLMKIIQEKRIDYMRRYLRPAEYIHISIKDFKAIYNDYKSKVGIKINAKGPFKLFGMRVLRTIDLENGEVFVS